MNYINHNFRNIILYISFIVFVSSFNFNANAQTNFETELQNLKHLEKSESEKVYLHLDRTIFAPGEDIWFKAYLLEGTYHSLSSTSNNLHVEIISPDGKIKSSQVILMHEGVGYGDIKLTRNIFKDGKYQVRAYTNFMRNFNDSIFFKKDILINSGGGLKNQPPTLSTKIDLQLFPEGGHLVQGVLNRIAFKAIDERGKGKKVELTIYDNQDNVIQKTQSVHNGMGQFMFIPKTNTSYYAVLDSPHQSSGRTTIPKATNGYSILVGNQFNNILDFNICTSPDNVHNQKISYIIQSRGKLFSTNKLKMDSGEKSIRIEKEKLPAGISSITVFDENGIAVCERLIYNQFSPEVKITVTANKKVYASREKVTLNIETTNEIGKPVAANLSLSVIGANISEKQKELLGNNSNILSSVLLNSDIKGHIENPSFYFENFDKKKHYYLDLLLLTQGWRKYVWKEKISTPAFAMDFDYESGFTFTGTAKTLALKRPISNSKVSLVMSDEGFYYNEVNANDKGQFTFKNTHFMDSTTLVFQGYNKKEKRNTVIEVEKIEYEAPSAKPVEQVLLEIKDTNGNDVAEQARKIKNIQDSLAAKNYHLLEGVTIKVQKKRDLDDHFRLYHRADEVIEVTDKYLGYNSIFDIIREIPAMHITGFCPEIEVSMRGRPAMANTITRSPTAAFLLDGMFVDAGDMCSIAVTQVDKIEVLKGASAAIFGSRGMFGIIAVYLKEAGMRWEQIPIGINKIKPKGYYRSREFYSPNYEMAQEQFEGPDYRNTLHWEPFITTGEKGKAEVSFYNSDDSGKYNITVEGVGSNGSIGKSEATFTVNTEKLSNN